MLAVPLIEKLTVTGSPLTALSVDVKVATAPASDILALSSVSETVGGISLSTTVVVTCWVPFSVPLLTVETSIVQCDYNKIEIYYIVVLFIL